MKYSYSGSDVANVQFLSTDTVRAADTGLMSMTLEKSFPTSRPCYRRIPSNQQPGNFCPNDKFELGLLVFDWIRLWGKHIRGMSR